MANRPASSRRTLAALERVGGGDPVATGEVADELDCPPGRCLERLRRLADEDVVGTRQVGGDTRIWWPTGGEHAPAAHERRLERRSQELEAELRAVFDRVDDAFFALDEDWRFTFVNERAADLLGRGDEDLVGQSVWAAFPDAVGSTFQTRYERAMATQETVSFREHYPPLDVTFSVTAYPSETGLSVYFRDVTDRLERRRELERYETIVETIDDGIYVVDDEGYFTQVNQRYADFVGLPKEELVGSHVSRVVSDEEVLREARQLEAELAAGDRETASLVAAFEGDDGGTRYAEATFALLETEAGRERVGAVRDVTDRRERERELERYETIVETVEDGIYAVDSDSRFVLVNEGFCELTGYTRAELLGADATKIYDDEIRPRAEAMAAAVESGDRGNASIELELDAASGERVPCESRFSPVPLADGTGRCGVVRDVSERRRHERELESRIRQNEAVARLGRLALVDHEHGFDRVMTETAELVTERLEADFCEVLELEPSREQFHLRAGVGWEAGVVGEATVSATDGDSQAARTLEHDEPVVVTDLERESRFDGPPLLSDHGVRAGITVLVGPTDDPWGVLGAHTTEPDAFSEHDIAFVQAVAHVLAAAVDRRDHEQALERQRNQLAALVDLNAVVREVTDAILEQSTRGEIERAVCERLTATDTYQSAWVGETDETGDVSVNAAGGAADPAPDRGAAAVARTGEAAVLGPDGDPHDRTRIVVPVAHEGVRFGLLAVETDQRDAVGRAERVAMVHLGEQVGHAIASIERKRALMGATAVELQYRRDDPRAGADLPPGTDGTVTVEETVPLGDGEYLAYGSLSGEAEELLAALCDRQAHWQSVSVDDGRFGAATFEARLSEPPIQSTLSAQGGEVVEETVTAEHVHLTVQVPPGANGRAVTDAVTASYPGAELVSRTQRDRSGERSFGAVEEALSEALTDRQRTALAVSYRSGFFEWPRKVTGEEVAARLDVAPSTFHQHLRAAERRVLEALLD